MGPYGLWELTPNPPENQSVKFEAFCRVTGGDRNLIMIVFFFCENGCQWMGKDTEDGVCPGFIRWYQVAGKPGCDCI